MRRHGIARPLCRLILAGTVACAPSADRKETSGTPPAGSATIGGETTIILDSATVGRVGLRTVAVTRSTEAAEIELPAQVVEDPGAAITVRAGVGGRLEEGSAGSWPEPGARLVAGAEVARIGDARPVVVPRSGTVVRLLAQPGELVQPGQPLIELMDFGSALVRVAWEPSSGAAPATLALSAVEGGSRVSGRLLGAAPEADPITRGAAWLYRVDAANSLRPGAALLAYLPDARAPRGGVLLPSDAVVQWDALTWAFVERAPGHFVRVRVPTDLPVAGGWLVGQGFAPGDRVVVRGASQLLSEEFRARITVGQEVGE